MQLFFLQVQIPAGMVSRPDFPTVGGMANGVGRVKGAFVAGRGLHLILYFSVLKLMKRISMCYMSVGNLDQVF